MTQLFTGTGLGVHGSSIGQLGGYGPKGHTGLGQGGESVYVNGATGNLVLSQSDGFLADAGFGLDVFQTYNSQGEGGAWRFNLETRLKVPDVPSGIGSTLSRVDEDGHVSGYHYDERQRMYVADDGSTARIIYDQGVWSYREGNDAICAVYDALGHLRFYIENRIT